MQPERPGEKEHEALAPGDVATPWTRSLTATLPDARTREPELIAGARPCESLQRFPSG